LLDIKRPESVCFLPRKPNGGGVSLMPNGRCLAMANINDRDVVIYDLLSGQPSKTLPAGKTAQALFSPDGQFLVVGEIDDYRILKSGTWESVFQLSRDGVGGGAGAAVFSPDGKFLALQEGQMGQIKVFKVGSWREVFSLEEGLPLCFSPDGQKLATFSSETKMLMVWDLLRIRKQLAALKLDWDQATAH
jgi:WD40 repeat protein